MNIRCRFLKIPSINGAVKPLILAKNTTKLYYRDAEFEEGVVEGLQETPLPPMFGTNELTQPPLFKMKPSRAKFILQYS